MSQRQACNHVRLQKHRITVWNFNIISTNVTVLSAQAIVQCINLIHYGEELTLFACTENITHIWQHVAEIQIRVRYGTEWSTFHAEVPYVERSGRHQFVAPQLPDATYRLWTKLYVHIEHVYRMKVYLVDQMFGSCKPLQTTLKT